MYKRQQYEGYLTKRAIKSGRNWKRRYFVLTKSALWYLKRKGSSKAKGQFSLEENTVVEDFDPSGTDGDTLPGIRRAGISRLNPMNRGAPVLRKSHCFRVRTGQRAIVLIAESVQLKALWVEAIGRVTKRMSTLKAPRASSSSSSSKVIPDAGVTAAAPRKRESGGLIGSSLRKMVSRKSSVRDQRIKEAEKAYAARVHKFEVSKTKFEVDRRYKLIRPVGQGAYGIVIAADDTANEEEVAIKKVTNAFEDLVDAKRILREIKLLRHFDHENVIHIKDILVPRSLSSFEDIYIVSELMETDLHRVIYSKQKLSEEHIQYFVYQIFRALRYIHSANVLHRDLKPGNILLNANCDLKICDFGLARGLEDLELELTEYVVTRWYRAPEIMLACREYTKAIDVWSVGCILAELFTRKPLFPGNDYIHQLKLICDVIGTPSEADIHFVTSERARRFMRKQPVKRRRPLAQMFPKNLPEGIDLLRQLLIFDPDKRITVDGALAHEYFQALHCPEDEPTHHSKFVVDDNKEEDDLEKREIQEAIYREICHFHPEQLSYFEAERTFPLDSLSGKYTKKAAGGLEDDMNRLTIDRDI